MDGCSDLTLPLCFAVPLSLAGDAADDASTLRLVAYGRSAAARAQAALDEAESEAGERAAGLATQDEQDAKRTKREAWPKVTSSLYYQAFWLNHFFGEPFRRRRDAVAQAAPATDAAPALAPPDSGTQTATSHCSSASSVAAPSAASEEAEEEAAEPCPFADEHPVLILMRQRLAELHHKRDRHATAVAGRPALEQSDFDGHGDSLPSPPHSAHVQQAEQLLQTWESDPAAPAAWTTLKRHFSVASSGIDCMWFSSICSTMDSRFPEVDTAVD